MSCATWQSNFIKPVGRAVLRKIQFLEYVCNALRDWQKGQGESNKYQVLLLHEFSGVVGEIHDVCGISYKHW